MSLQLESIANYSKIQDSPVNRLSLFSCCNNSENLEFNFVLFSLSLIIKLQQFIDFHTFMQAPMLMQMLYFTRTNALSNFREENNVLFMKTLNINLYKYWCFINNMFRKISVSMDLKIPLTVHVGNG